MAISFAELSASYPTTQFPCGDGWENQCAIRMSIALEGAGFSLADYSDPKCSHGHARGAESLANYLWRSLARPLLIAWMRRVRSRSASTSKPTLIFNVP